ncbi:hypothetical protein [Natrinema sp. 1APR25-10V2]|uniref:hypothetical protein n=1 Tax=Natrinema sp. 1APR25-10V2 TaxID=2951081 RepID=UPI002874CFAA|nr:hypothetical protein [Natrinema sp. 1APR25-10V2]MDS0475917.1 hypothetical protein [Natrinema sp. 1APR25-10V2]
MNRRSVIAGIVTTTPLFAGCAEQGSSVQLEPRNVLVVGNDHDGWTWDVTFDVWYHLNALAEGEGFYGVRSHLVATDGEEIDRFEHGDLPWHALETDERTRDETEAGTEYNGTYRETVSATADRFPNWIVFTVDRTETSGRALVSVSGVTAADPVPLESPETDDRNRTDTETGSRGSEADTGDHKNETGSKRLEIADDDWTKIELKRYQSFPPTAEIASAANATSNRTQDTPTDRNVTDDRDVDSNSSG